MNQMPHCQMYTMVAQRLRSLMMSTSIDTLREHWRVHDKKRHGLLNEEQFEALLADCNIEGFAKEDLQGLISEYSGGKSKITFDDFVFNLLGMPHDFFCR